MGENDELKINIGFFNNLSIPASVKMSVTALLLGGTYNSDTVINNRKIFTSLVAFKDKPVVPVSVEHGCGESIAKIAAQGQLKMLGLSDYSENFINNKLKDEDFTTILAEKLQTNLNLSDVGIKEKIESNRNNVSNFIETWNKHGGDLEKTSVESLMDSITKSVDLSKKKIVTDQSNQKKVEKQEEKSTEME